jgi:hypothetical protein
VQITHALVPGKTCPARANAVMRRRNSPIRIGDFGAAARISAVSVATYSRLRFAMMLDDE